MFLAMIGLMAFPKLTLMVILNLEVMQSTMTHVILDFHSINLTIQNKNLLDIVFANFSDVNAYNSYFDLIEPDALRPSLVIHLSIFLPSYTQSPRLFRKYGRGDYVLFYNYLSSYD
jgi:hypothetical protein